ncbi:hypothetical protein MMC34_004053 [Xylographa carneopallida]|nr:hypothetical protein [Xylographa carneopallida]
MQHITENIITITDQNSTSTSTPTTMPNYTLSRSASTPNFEIEHRSLRRSASAEGLETGPLPWELPTETTTTGSTSLSIASETAITAESDLSHLHDQLAANFQQLSIAIEQIKALEAQLATGKGASSEKGAKLERKLAGHREHRDSLGTQRRRLLGKRDRAERTLGLDVR